MDDSETALGGLWTPHGARTTILDPPKVDFGLSKDRFRTLRSANFGLSERSRLEVPPWISCESIRQIAKFRPRFVAKFRPPLLRFRPRSVDSRGSVLRGSALDCPRSPAVHSRSSVLDSSIRDVPPSVLWGSALESSRRCGLDSRGSILDSSDVSSSFLRGFAPDASIHEVPPSIRKVASSIRRFARFRPPFLP